MWACSMISRSQWAATAFGRAALVVLLAVACRPGDVLNVPAPAGVLGSTALQNQTGAEGTFNAAKAQLFGAADGWWYNGVLTWSELLTDEFRFSGFTIYATYAANVDARMTGGGGGFQEEVDFAWGNLSQARSGLLAAVPGLRTYESGSGRSKIGEAYALTGYAELVLAESYCAGTPLDAVRADGTIQYGIPLTTDSLLGVAEAHLDSAMAAANGDPTTLGLASVGLGRALLDRGRYAAAAAAVQNVPVSFVYSDELEPSRTVGASHKPNTYAHSLEVSADRFFNVADREGQNGLNFVSARDPRLTLDSSLATTDGGTWYLPTKFEASLSDVPLATGIEARLIAAEAALQAHDAGAWLVNLNALRNSGCTISATDTTCSLGSGQVSGQTTGLPSLADPGTDSGRVSLMFRERAFWLFGTGTRLGDLRRLVRQYGRDQSTVFPTGPYPNGNDPNLPSPIPSYGADVSLTLPTPFGLSSNGLTETNPNYRGCMTSTKVA